MTDISPPPPMDAPPSPPPPLDLPPPLPTTSIEGSRIYLYITIAIVIVLSILIILGINYFRSKWSNSPSVPPSVSLPSSSSSSPVAPPVTPGVTYGPIYRGPGTALPCTSDQEQYAQLCFPKCETVPNAISLMNLNPGLHFNAVNAVCYPQMN